MKNAILIKLQALQVKSCFFKLFITLKSVLIFNVSNKKMPFVHGVE